MEISLYHLSNLDLISFGFNQYIKVVYIHINYHPSFKNNCLICGNAANIYRKQSGQFMCNECFIRSIEKIINKTISKYSMLNPQDSIVVALSGGKDSITLLYNLIKIQRETYNSKELIALTIDEGIEGYRDKSINLAKEFCKAYGIEHHIISFKNEFGLSLNEIVRRKNDSEDSLYTCNYCAIIRRRLLNDYAKKLGGTILALGHNLTDFAETFLMNILYKRINLIGNQYLFRKEPDIMHKYYIKKIFPLMRIPEDEILLYANLKKLIYYPKHCPYRDKDPILRKRVLHFIQETKKMSPEIEYNLFNTFIELSELIYKNKPNHYYRQCKNCGYPSGKSKLCTYCSLKALSEK